MDSFSVWHWVVVLALALVWLVPAAKILAKAGYSGWWCVLLLVPVINIVAYWAFAFAQWPRLRA
jgi:uncharacterized membrane protein YhaH (DUF805 family)